MGPLAWLYIALEKGGALPGWARDTVSGILPEEMAFRLRRAMGLIRRKE